MSKTIKQSETSKCPMCGKKNNTKWMYCSDKCVIKARKRAQEENKLLHLRAENAQLSKHAWATELEAEGLTGYPVYVDGVA